MEIIDVAVAVTAPMMMETRQNLRAGYILAPVEGKVAARAQATMRMLEN